jgi:hypothetical protein
MGVPAVEDLDTSADTAVLPSTPDPVVAGSGRPPPAATTTSTISTDTPAAHAAARPRVCGPPWRLVRRRRRPLPTVRAD